MLFCYFLSFASLHVAPDVGLGFITCNFPLKSFLFHDDCICVCFIWSASLESRKSRQRPHTYINGMLHNYLHEDRAWAGCRSICHVLRLLFSRFLGIPCFPLVEIQETECWLQHSNSAAFNFLSIELFWYKSYAGELLPPEWVMIFQLCSAPHAQSETKHESPACLFHTVVAVRSKLCWIGSIAQYHYSLRSTEHFLELLQPGRYSFLSWNLRLSSRQINISHG